MDKHTKKLLSSYQKTFFILLFLIPGVKNNRKKMKCLIGKVAVVIIICIFVIE